MNAEVRKPDDSACEVVLVHVPYVMLEEPSIALGTLKAEAVAAGYSCRVLFANLWFAETIGIDVYGMINQLFRIPALGDWTFARAAFPDYNPDHRRVLEYLAERYLKNAGAALCHDRAARERLVQVFYRTREQTPPFAARTAEKILELNPMVVGCGSTFEQHAAALAVLRAVREKNPAVVTVMGGANCEGVMGACAVRNYPWVDYAFSGEADELFPEFCGLVRRHGRSIPAEKLHPAIFRRDTAAAFSTPPWPRAVCSDLDALPVPDYSDYFSALQQFRYRAQVLPALLFESSRGCWWGARRHCVFCGRNRQGNEYRMKSPGRILREMDELFRRHSIKRIAAADNIIAPAHFTSVLPELARRGRPYSLYMETKANLTRAQVRLLAEAGVNWFQPGIEALHDEILARMHKGTRTHINLQALKYAREYGLRVSWHMLFGNPGDRDAWYAEIMEWLPSVIHFPPPSSLIPVIFVRFSPYFQNPEKYGLQLTPFNHYGKVFPLPPDQLRDQAYYFQNTGPWNQRDFLNREKRPAFNRLCDFVPRWRAAYYAELPPLLCMTDTPQGVDIFDTRPGAVERRTTLTGLAADICRICDPAVLREHLPDRLHECLGTKPSPDRIAAALAELRRRGIVIQLPSRWLLTVALTGDVPAPTALFPHGAVKHYNLQKILNPSGDEPK